MNDHIERSVFGVLFGKIVFIRQSVLLRIDPVMRLGFLWQI